MILKTDRPAVLRNTETAFLRATDEVVGEMRKNAPVGVSRGMKLNAGDIQGSLRASLTFVRTGRLSGRAGSAKRYAMMREKGGVIVPIRKKLLSWIDPVTGQRIFAKRVVQRPGGPRQGHKSFIGPAGDKFPDFMEDHLKSMP
jgi:hypothetical protein